MPPFDKKPQSQGGQSRPPQTGGQQRPFQQGGQRPAQAGGARPATGGQRPPMSGGARPAMNSGQRPQQSGGQRSFQGGNRDQKMTYINDMIKAPKVLLIDENGEKLGLLSRDEALKRAYAEGLDLVQLAYNPLEMICTAKIVDYGKYQYNKQKDEKEKKKNQKSKGGKDIKMSYTIGDNDLQLKIKHAEEFLDDGYTVRFLVRLKGREKIFADKMIEKLKGVEAQLEPKGKSQGVKEEPNGISLFLLPKSK